MQWKHGSNYYDVVGRSVSAGLARQLFPKLVLLVVVTLPEVDSRSVPSSSAERAGGGSQRENRAVNNEERPTASAGQTVSAVDSPSAAAISTNVTVNRRQKSPTQQQQSNGKRQSAATADVVVKRKSKQKSRDDDEATAAAADAAPGNKHNSIADSPKQGQPKSPKTGQRTSTTVSSQVADRSSTTTTAAAAAGVDNGVAKDNKKGHKDACLLNPTGKRITNRIASKTNDILDIATACKDSSTTSTADPVREIVHEIQSVCRYTNSSGDRVSMAAVIIDEFADDFGETYNKSYKLSKKTMDLYRSGGSQNGIWDLQRHCEWTRDEAEDCARLRLEARTINTHDRSAAVCYAIKEVREVTKMKPSCKNGHRKSPKCAKTTTTTTTKRNGASSTS